MRKLLVLLLILPLAFSCEKKPEGVVITGLIENSDNNFFVMGGPGGSRDTVLLDETGVFTYQNTGLEKAALHYMFLDKDVVYIWLANGMEMDFYADMKMLKETMGFSGSGADINNYQAAKNMRAFDYNWSSLGEDEYLFKLDSLLAEQQGNLNSVEKDNPEDPYWTMEEAELLYSWGSNLENFQSMHQYYALDPDFKVSENFYNFRDQLGFDHPEYLESSAFNNYISTVISQKVGEEINTLLEADSTADFDRGILAMTIASKDISNEEVLNKYLTSYITGRMQWTDLSELEAAIDFFKTKVTDEKSLAKFNEEFDAWQKLSKGAPMFDFVGKDLQGNTVRSEDFRGKYLYVDVWATWCGPCKYEIPFLKQLEADYHERNIVFLSYSIDEDKDAWLEFVPREELGGVQIIGEAAWESDLCKNYKVRGVPTFMFFDPQGKIINVKMTRPSDQKTRDTFDSFSDL